MHNKYHTVGEVDGFINMLLAACENEDINKSLETLLSQPEDKRKNAVKYLAVYLNSKGAPKDLIEAIECLYANDVAEKAYEYICQCQRG